MSARDATEATAASSSGPNDPRALEILTTEHWSLLSYRNLGYQEMFGRTTIFVAILSGTVVALALLAQATHFSREALSIGLLLMLVDLFIGLTTFGRSVAINLEDATWVEGMTLIRSAYLRIVPDLAPFFVAEHEPGRDPRPLGHGAAQSAANLAASLSTTSSVVATLNSVLAGVIASDIAALAGWPLGSTVATGAVVSLVSGALHARLAARFRQRHVPSPEKHGR
jgi:hypothetical protein